ncbi:MAG: hypothetical protein WAU23_11810 [Ferruginibacter sp.]
MRKGTILLMTITMLSCNGGGGKAGVPKEEASSEGVGRIKNNDLIYLDTAQHIQNILCQGWVIEDDADALEGMDEDSKFEIPYRSFYFATNGSFVKNPRNAMDYGSWRFDDDSKTIFINTTVERGEDKYKIAKVSSAELILVNVGINSATNLKFIGPAKRFKNETAEPFFLENNRWRIKPKATESDSAIHQRLKENIRFFILFYKSVLAKDDAAVSFWGLPSCFNWFGGGISIKKPEALAENWINCFYNKEQAMKAYALAVRLLRQQYEWPKGEQNWLKQNLAVVELMYKKLDEIR